MCGFFHNLPFPIYLSSSAAHLLVLPRCQVGIWWQHASGLSSRPAQLLGFQGTGAVFFFQGDICQCARDSAEEEK